MGQTDSERFRDCGRKIRRETETKEGTQRKKRGAKTQSEREENRDTERMRHTETETEKRRERGGRGQRPRIRERPTRRDQGRHRKSWGCRGGAVRILKKNRDPQTSD